MAKNEGLMEEKKEKEPFEMKPVGKKMVELIAYVKKRFMEEYGFEPSIISTTNIIAKRVMDKRLF